MEVKIYYHLLSLLLLFEHRRKLYAEQYNCFLKYLYIYFTIKYLAVWRKDG